MFKLQGTSDSQLIASSLVFRKIGQGKARGQPTLMRMLRASFFGLTEDYCTVWAESTWHSHGHRGPILGGALYLLPEAPPQLRAAVAGRQTGRTSRGQH